MQRQAAGTLRVTLAFVLASVGVAAGGVGDGPWLALHLFLLGGVITAIAAATQLLAVTWSAAPAPHRRSVVLQRWCFAGGASAVAFGREVEQSPVAVVGGVVVIVGLALLAGSLVTIRRAGRNDRFRPAIEAYLIAFGCAGVGMALGIAMIVVDPSVGWVRMRGAHVTLNLFGLVGIVIAGTLPAFVATQARTKMSKRASARNQRCAVAVLAAGVVLTAAAQLTDVHGLVAAGRVLYLSGLLGVLFLLPHVSSRQLRWAGPRLVQLAAGLAWWLAIVAALAVGDLDGRPPATDLLAGLAVGGVAQVLVASLAYLAPVLRGGGHRRLAAGFATTRSWTSLLAGNLAAGSIVAGLHRVAVVALVAWAAEVVVRTALLGRRRPPHARSETSGETEPSRRAQARGRTRR